MKITREFLLEQIKRMESQKIHAHEVAVASQAAIDVMQSLIARLDLPEPQSNIQESENGSV